ncbi:MAG: hypothetical protein H7234_06790, partial [Herminiimonas sp.]|nr:hypothetical protein [Herminiimonas sp.]
MSIRCSANKLAIQHVRFQMFKNKFFGFDWHEAAGLACPQKRNRPDICPDVLCERVTSLAARLFAAPVAMLVLVDADRLQFKSCHGIDINENAHNLPVDASGNFYC